MLNLPIIRRIFVGSDIEPKLLQRRINAAEKRGHSENYTVCPMLFPLESIPYMLSVKEKFPKAEKIRAASIAWAQNEILYVILTKPAVKSGKKKPRNKAHHEWEPSSIFEGSITIIERNYLEVQTELQNWSDEKLREAHEWVLMESLEALKDEENQDEKLDILDWIFSPDVITKMGVSQNGRSCLVSRHQFDIPFSFLNCCRAVGIRDADAFRIELLDRMNDTYRPALTRYLRATNCIN
jgi:hypothetical protein